MASLIFRAFQDNCPNRRCLRRYPEEKRCYRCGQRGGLRITRPRLPHGTVLKSRRQRQTPTRPATSSIAAALAATVNSSRGRPSESLLTAQNPNAKNHATLEV